MSFADIEAAINHYGKKAASGSLALEDMAGGTFTMCVLYVCVCVCALYVCVRERERARAPPLFLSLSLSLSLCLCLCLCLCLSSSHSLHSVLHTCSRTNTHPTTLF
jgi:hypothetical protein